MNSERNACTYRDHTGLIIAEAPQISGDLLLEASDPTEMVASNSLDWLPTGWTEHVKVNNGRKVKVFRFLQLIFAVFPEF